MSEANEEPLMTVADVAKRLNVSKSTITRQAAAGKIPCVKLPGWKELRFNREHIERWIARNSYQPDARSARVRMAARMSTRERDTAQVGETSRAALVIPTGAELQDAS